MKKFKYFEHTADAKFQAYGKNLEEAFSNSALAIVGLMTKDKIAAKIKKKIKVNGKDLKQLLSNFLEQFLFLLDSKNFILSKINKIDINVKKLELKAEISGDNVKDYEIFGDVKAITYNSMEIIREKKRIVIQVVVDM